MIPRHRAALTLAALFVASCSDATRSTDPTPARSAFAPGKPASMSITPGVVSGPVDQAPGGSTLTITGSANEGIGAMWAFSNINPSLFATLAWLPTTVQLSMNGVPNTLTLEAGSGGVWTGTSPVMLSSGPSTVNLRVEMEVFDENADPHEVISTSSSAATALGLPAAMGVADIVDGSGFRLLVHFYAQHPRVFSGNYAPFLDVYHALMTNEGAQPNQALFAFNGGFYYTLKPCSAGQFYNGSLCTDAPPGTFSLGGTATSATPCMAGTYNPLAAQAACVPAPAGSFVDAAGATTFVRCVAGKYQPQAGQITCITAAPGSYVNTFGATASIPCAPGTFTPNAGAFVCFVSSFGYYVAETGATVQTPCSPGFFQPNQRQTECFPAPAGSFVAGTAATASATCTPGTYQPNAGQSSCLVSPAGSYVDIAGAIAANPCPAGKFQPLPSSITCIVASPGHYVGTPGAIAETPCAPGTFTSFTAQTACISAPAGTFATGPAATSTSTCSIGTFSTGGAAACTPAPAGSFVDHTGAISATLCAAGRYTSAPGLGACNMASPGYYVSTVGASAQTPCAPGYYSTSFGSTSCTIVPPGNYATGPAATAGTPCAPGTFSAIPGATACTPAPVGSYVPLAGAITSYPCPAGTTTIVPGSSACQTMIAQTIAFTSAPPSSAMVGGTYVVSANGGASGNPVTLSASGGACTVAGNTVTFTAAGTCVITANQAGGGLYFAAPAATQSFTVAPPTPQALATVVGGQVQALVSGGALSAADASPLNTQLDAAVKSYEHGNDRAGDNQMGAFINHVQALQRSGRLSTSAANALIAAAQNVIAIGG